jgi:hypothetical protein
MLLKPPHSTTHPVGWVCFSTGRAVEAAVFFLSGRPCAPGAGTGLTVFTATVSRTVMAYGPNVRGQLEPVSLASQFESPGVTSVQCTLRERVLIERDASSVTVCDRCTLQPA